MQLEQSRARRALPPASSGYKLCLVPRVEGHHSVIFLKPSDLPERHKGTQGSSTPTFAPTLGPVMCPAAGPSCRPSSSSQCALQWGAKQLSGCPASI